MRYTTFAIIFLIACFLLTSGIGCCLFSGPGRDRAESRETPQKTLEVFRKALETKDYSTAYHCLSKDTKARYQFSHFSLMFEWTVFGVLIRNMIIYWEVESTKYSRDHEKATLRLRHQRYPSYKKDFTFVYEDGWRIDFTLAHILGMPQEDEDMLFPPKPEEDKNKPKPKDEGSKGKDKTTEQPEKEKKDK
jgi:hypothetical protein